jgi:hypothetical protein
VTTLLLSVETLLLVLLAVLVAGLLRSHAEILQSLARLGEDGIGSRLPTEAEAPGAPAAADVVGTTLDGEAAAIRVRGRPGTLLVFLTSGCSTCKRIWRELADPERSALPGGAKVVVVAKDRGAESISRLRRVAPADVPLVLASGVWDSYRVPGSPYFVFVDEHGVRGEGSADEWERVVSFVEDALGDIAEEEAYVARIAQASGEPGYAASTATENGR